MIEETKMADRMVPRKAKVRMVPMFSKNTFYCCIIQCTFTLFMM